MAIPGLSIIAESINDSVPSTRTLYDAGDLAGIGELARTQQEKGAAYIDVNIGSRPAEFMPEVVDAVQKTTTLPLSIDSPDPNQAEVGLRACDPSRGKPILNSISPCRMEMFKLYAVRPFRPILLISEYIDAAGLSQATKTAEETLRAARQLFDEAKKYDIPNDDLIFDPGIAPLGSDTEGHLKRVLDTLEGIRNMADMKGVHASVGLSNFTIMLPPKTRKTKSPVKGPLESAFLAMAMPRGLDYVIGSVRRNYAIPDEDSPALACLRECLANPGFATLSRVRAFYTESRS